MSETLVYCGQTLVISLRPYVYVYNGPALRTVLSGDRVSE